MIVIVGSPVAKPIDGGIAAAGLGAAVARAAAAAGAAVQIVGRVGEDATGDGVLLDLAATGIGHVAVLREPGRPTPAAPPPTGESPNPDSRIPGELLGESAFHEHDQAQDAAGEPAHQPAGLSVDAADLELALRYVPDYRVLVVAAELEPSALAAAVAAAAWSGAFLIALAGDGSSPAVLPDTATVFEPPPADLDGAFASMVAAYAVALDEGTAPVAAFAAAQRAGGWAAVAD